MDIEQIKERLAKMMALAERGVGGERDAAERLIQEIAAKHGISLDDIGSEVEREHVVSVKKSWQLQIFIQLLGLMRIEQYGDRYADKLKLFTRRQYVQTHGRKSRGQTRRRTVACYFTVCTDAQWLELEAKYVVLLDDYDRQIKAFPLAFLIRNNLLMPYDQNGKNTSKKEDELYHDATLLAEGIQKSSLNKQLEHRIEEARL